MSPMPLLFRRPAKGGPARRWLTIGGAVVALCVLVIAAPLAWSWWQGNRAQAALEDAYLAVLDHDNEAAAADVERARTHTDHAVAAREGVLGTMWRHLPVLSGAYADSVRMADSLDALTSIAEEGVALAPRLSGDTGSLVTDGQVDLDQLAEALDAVQRIEARVEDAERDLAAVEADSALLGWKIADMRDDGVEGMRPLRKALDTAAPLTDVLPDLLGADGRRDYLVAILNPAELLYSGGTPLTFTQLTVRDGRIDMGEPIDTATHGEEFRPRWWRKVKGNPFHRGRLRIGTATFAPDWSVSGEELVRAWRSLGHGSVDGVIAVDVMALRDLVAITGPLDVPYYGPVTADNFVPILIGNYDSIEDYRVRHQINQMLVPIFRDRLFSTGRFTEKFQALAANASGRHFAVYLRDPHAQSAFRDLGLTGELSDTEHDYLGVFTQNAVPSKTDYWQNRSVDSVVRLRADGSAEVTTTTTIHNDGTPYPFKGRDPRHGYSTRFATLSIAQFLPLGVEEVHADVDGDPVTVSLNDFFDRPFVRHTVAFKPQAEHELTTSYVVPRAAIVDGDTLDYRLDVDPQGMVRPSAISVELHPPEGYTVEKLPKHWVRLDDGAVGWGGPALVYSPRMRVRLTR